MSSPTHDWASYEQRRLLLQVSECLKQKDGKKIVFLEELPKELEDKEPWEVLAHLQVRGKATPEELIRILRDANLPGAVKKVKELSSKSKKAAVTRKDSGPCSLKLEESVQLTSKNCDVLVEQMAYLELAAHKGGKTRIEEMVTEANKILQTQVQRKLKYVSGLLNSENLAADNENVPVKNNSSSSPPSSPESSLTVPRSPTHQRTLIKDSELQQVAKRLKPASGIRGLVSSPRTARNNTTNNTSHKTSKQPALQPPSIGVQNRHIVTPSVPHPVQVVNTYEDEDIYTLPGPPTTKSLSASKTDVQYYNVPPPITRTDNQSTDSTSLVIASTKSVKVITKKPATTPKPIASNKGSQAAKRDGSSLQIPDDTVDTSTGDSGFSDSTAFLKETAPLSSLDDPASTARAQQVSESDATYASLIKSEVKGSDYYKTLQSNRDAIPDVVYDNNR